MKRDAQLVVSSLDHNQMAELYVVRAELEGLAAKLAAKHATDEEKGFYKTWLITIER